MELSWKVKDGSVLVTLVTENQQAFITGVIEV